jgi:predicted transcriptional regulator
MHRSSAQVREGLAQGARPYVFQLSQEELLVSTGLQLALARIVQNRVYSLVMTTSARRVNVTLDDEHANKLARLAKRTHVQEGTLARSLLSTALDDADPDAARITEILDAIPGAWERTQEGLAQAARGEGTPLDELA